MSDEIKKARLVFPRLIAEEICSVQPMTGTTDFFLKTEWTGAVYEHTPGDGTFCGCWGRCYVCEPLTEEEKVAAALPGAPSPGHSGTPFSLFASRQMASAIEGWLSGRVGEDGCRRKHRVSH